MKIALIAHSTLLEGPVHNIEKYYRSKHFSVVKITHPLDEYENRSSEVSVNSRILKSFRRRPLGILNYFIDFYLSFILLMKYEPQVIVGCDNFDTVAGIVYKKIFGKKDVMIMYFASDFSPKRFGNAVLNMLYTWIEKIALTSSDYVISNTYRAEAERLKMGLEQDKSRVIPNCIMVKPEKTKKTYVKNDFIYIGSLTKEHGLYEFIKKTFGLMHSILIIGEGYEKDAIVAFLKTKKIRYTIIDQMERSKVRSYLARFSGFGLAPYTSVSLWTKYCSPLKVIEYLAFGIPVIMSDIPEVSEEIVRHSLGIVYNQVDKISIGRKIQKFSFVHFSDKAYQFSKKYYFQELYKNLPI